VGEGVSPPSRPTSDRAHEAGAGHRSDLSMMSWREVEAALLERPAVLIPVGTSEAQGTHNPLAADYLLAHAFAQRVAEASGSVYLTGVPYGNSVAFRGFPGVVWLRPSTLENVVLDVCRSLAYHGFDHLIVVNNHGPNEPAIETALRTLRDESGLLVPVLWPSALARRWNDEVFPPGTVGHGAEPMTSLLRHLVADGLPPLQPEPGAYHEWQGLAPESSTRAGFEGSSIGLYLDVSEYSETAARTLPSADPELGRQLMERLVAYGVRFVSHFREMEMGLGKRSGG